MEFNFEINFIKNQINYLSDIANTGRCWPGAATSTGIIPGGPDLAREDSWATFAHLNEELENMMNADNLSGPNVRYDTDIDLWNPYVLRKLTPEWAGAGRYNIVDGWKYNGPTSDNPSATFPATVGFRSDGGDNDYSDTETNEDYEHNSTVNITQEARFEISTTLADHTAIILLPNTRGWVGPPTQVNSMQYLGANISDWNGLSDGEACVGIANSIKSIYAEIEGIRTERNLLRTKLNSLKGKKTEKEIVSWGLHNQDSDFERQKIDNENAIAAINDLL